MGEYARRLRSGRTFGGQFPTASGYQYDPYSMYGPPPPAHYPPPPHSGFPTHPTRGYPEQIPTDQHAEHSPVSTTSSKVSETLSAIKTMLSSVPPTSEFEKNIVNVLNILIGQMQDMQAAQHQTDLNSMRNSFAVSEMDISIIKTEQYSRRDCLTVSGLKQSEGESSKMLGDQLASVLSKSGVPVKKDDMSAFHRNSAKGKQIKLRDGTTKQIPPTVTVRFKSINQKDELVKTYKNFDSDKSKPNEVQIYHSLSRHYSSLRGDIVQFFKGQLADPSRCKVQPNGKALKWVKYLSPSAGLAVKLKSDEFMKGIHTWNDFEDRFHKFVELGEHHPRN